MSASIPECVVRGVSFSRLVELRPVEGDGGGEDVPVSGDDPGGDNVGGGGKSSTTGVTGDWC